MSGPTSEFIEAYARARGLDPDVVRRAMVAFTGVEEFLADRQAANAEPVYDAEYDAE